MEPGPILIRLGRVYRLSHLLALCHTFSVDMVCMLYGTFLEINHHAAFLELLVLIELPTRGCIISLNDTPNTVAVSLIALTTSEICKHCICASCGVHTY